MTTPRIFRAKFSASIKLLAEEFKHIHTVLRKKSGCTIEVVFEEERALYNSELNTDLRLLENLNLQKKEEISSFECSLAVPLLKASGVEEVIDAATQLGIEQIHIFQAEHSVAKFGDKQAARLKRYQACTEAAAAQSKRLSVPKILIFKNLQSLIDNNKNSEIICCVIEEREEINQKVKKTVNKNYLIITGPEGDFSGSELALLKEKQSIFVSLGKNILRANLAPIVAFVQLKVLWEE